MVESIVQNKSFRFSIKIVRLYLRLMKNSECRSIYEQILKSGTSIGANIAEAQRSQSARDFTAKMHIALKEASETEYWLKLMYQTGLIHRSDYYELLNDCVELLKILTAIVKTSKSKSI